MIEKFIERMFEARNASHIQHWKTGSYAQHKALGHYYDDVISTLDKFVEAYQGAFGLVGDVEGETRDIVRLINDDLIWLNENRAKLAKGVPALENILDDLTATHMRTLYKLENLK